MTFITSFFIWDAPGISEKHENRSKSTKVTLIQFTTLHAIIRDPTKVTSCVAVKRSANIMLHQRLFTLSYNKVHQSIDTKRV